MVELTVQRLWKEQEGAFKLACLTPTLGMERVIRVPRIQKPGLALTGYHEQLHPGRVLILGGTEIEYLKNATAQKQQLGIDTMMASGPACVVITRELQPPELLVTQCRESKVPLFVSELISSDFISRIRGYLQVQLSPKEIFHGVLIDVLGMGILIRGKSGIGKSEAALDLVVRGHRLVADDAVEAWRVGPNLIYGRSAGIIAHHMEVRGLGIINIRELYGRSAVRTHKKIEMVIELFAWNEDADHDRLGVDDSVFGMLGEELPLTRIPVRPGRNVATIIEVGARNQLLKLQGHHSARLFREELADEMSKSQSQLEGRGEA